MTPYAFAGITHTETDCNTIADLCGVDWNKLDCRKPEYAIRRQVAMALLSIFNTDNHLIDIGKQFGKNHTTVIYSRKVMEAALFCKDESITDILIPVFNVLYFSHLSEAKKYQNLKDKSKMQQHMIVNYRLHYYAFTKLLIKGIESGRYKHELATLN